MTGSQTPTSSETPAAGQARRPDSDPPLSDSDMRILRELDDVWRNIYELVGLGLRNRMLAARLRVLRRRGLVAYRMVDHDHRAVGEWALTPAGDQLVLDVEAAGGSRLRG